MNGAQPVHFGYEILVAQPARSAAGDDDLLGDECGGIAAEPAGAREQAEPPVAIGVAKPARSGAGVGTHPAYRIDHRMRFERAEVDGVKTDGSRDAAKDDVTQIVDDPAGLARNSTHRVGHGSCCPAASAATLAATLTPDPNQSPWRRTALP